MFFSVLCRGESPSLFIFISTYTYIIYSNFYTVYVRLIVHLHVVHFFPVHVLVSHTIPSFMPSLCTCTIPVYILSLLHFTSLHTTELSIIIQSCSLTLLQYFYFIQFLMPVFRGLYFDLDFINEGMKSIIWRITSSFYEFTCIFIAILLIAIRLLISCIIVRAGRDQSTILTNFVEIIKFKFIL